MSAEAVMRGALAASIAEATPTRPPPPRFLPSMIVQATADAFNITTDELINGGRKGSRCDARHVAVALVYTMTELSMPLVGKLFRRDHTTILSSLRRVEDSPELISWAASVRRDLEAAKG